MEKHAVVKFFTGGIDIMEKHPYLVMIIGIIGISLSAIFVRYSSAPSVVTAAYRLLWTVLLLTPTVIGKDSVRKELLSTDKKTVFLSALSGVFLAIHFATWFESLKHTSVSSSTIIVCTEVIWVALGYCLFLKGKLSLKAVTAIAVTLLGSILIALADSSGTTGHLYGDILSLIAAIAVGIYTLLGRVVRGTTSTTVYTYIVYVFSALSLVIMTLAQGTTVFGHGLSGLFVGLLLAVFSTLLGHSIFSWCLKFFSPAFVSAVKLCEPVIASIIAAILFAEIPGLIQVAGSVIVLAGVLYYSYIEINGQSEKQS